MKSAYEQLTKVTDGHDPIVYVHLSALAELLDSRLNSVAKQEMIDDIIHQLERRPNQ